ncbi:MAG: membrane protein insertase YidC [Elusimicrobiota bacterium]|jgi:YidC/Oxa1 family membrane protein insertase|nr:membrane protein insertase YidC [Elusimicrobiota bacterium]
MQKNTILFVVCSAITMFVWFFYFTPQQQSAQIAQSNADVVQNQKDESKEEAETLAQSISADADIGSTKEEEFLVETDKFKAVFSNKGASILSWSIKEKSGQWVDLVFPNSAPAMSNFPGSVYKIISQSKEKITFEYSSMQGWKIIKTFNLSDAYMHNLNIEIEKSSEASFPQISVDWGPGLGTDERELKENTSLTRVTAYTLNKPFKLKKLKNNSFVASDYKWSAVDNRYFLAAFIPNEPADFNQIMSNRANKKVPYSLQLTANPQKDINKKAYSLDFYLGPKDYTYLKTYNLGLEKTVDFGFFGFLGKLAFAVLSYFHKLTSNYGWAIIMLTICIQILVLPLTLKSFKSAAAMKRIQPLIKDIQTKYKDDPKRLQAEMLHIYRNQKVNPLGGCLPMLLQLPIFWAFFTMLRNAYELRNEGWILWVKDLSTADQFMTFGSFSLNLLPLIMGLGMFFQQKMTTAVSDPTQKKIMYILPIVFTFMFWTFPSGLVIYWLTNSVISMIEQYFVIKKDTATNIKHA